MTEGALTPSQLGALLDILIHNETYTEVQSFRDPRAIEEYGWPFVDRDDKGMPAGPHRPSSSPLLQLLLTRIVLGAPAARDLSTEFWPVKFKGIMRRLGEADLSDSYDKGTLGTRKRLATAASVIHESVTRALLSGISRSFAPDLQGSYSRESAEGLTSAWNDSIHHLVYGNLLDEVFDQLARTEDLEAHSPAVAAAVEYAELYMATFLHQVFVLSAEGPYLLKLIENVHKLLPYTVIGQTLRLGNAASMINGMSKLFLSKVSVGALSNWIGLTSNAADGMNLMERIISSVLDWDASDFRKAAEKIKQNKESISSEHVKTINAFLAGGREQHESTRERSIKEQKSIIVAIFESTNQPLLNSLTDLQHASCLQYYATQLAIRDREQLTEVICGSTPDLTTAIVLEGLAALDPMIRIVHKNVDLRKHLNAMEGFLTDFIKMTKVKTQDNSSEVRLLTVKDFFQLLHRNRHLLWAYLHDFCSGCPELRDVWREWMNNAIKIFRRKTGQDANEGSDPIHREPRAADAGDMGPSLQSVFYGLPESQKETVKEGINAHSKYLKALKELTRAKMQSVIDDVHEKSHADIGDTSGPGIYAARWQALLDETLITPATQKGPLRCGKDIKGLKAVRKADGQGSSGTSEADMATLTQQGSAGPTPPNVCAVIEALGPHFKEIVANISLNGLPNA